MQMHFLLGLSNGTQERQMYSATRDTPRRLKREAKMGGVQTYEEFTSILLEINSNCY
jgi:hypothetical protein